MKSLLILKATTSGMKPNETTNVVPPLFSCAGIFPVSRFPCQPCKTALLRCWELPLPELKGYLELCMGTNPADSQYWPQQLLFLRGQDTPFLSHTLTHPNNEVTNTPEFQTDKIV